MLMAGITTAFATSIQPVPTITPDGFGLIKIGMSTTDALKLLGDTWHFESASLDENGKEDDSCGFLNDGGTDSPVYFMVESGKVTRVDARLPSVNTDKGIHIGSSEDDVREAYGTDVRAMAHEYEEAPAQYLTVWTVGAPPAGQDYAEGAETRGIRFSTGPNRLVEEIYAGGTAIQYIEGCS